MPCATSACVPEPRQLAQHHHLGAITLARLEDGVGETAPDIGGTDRHVVIEIHQRDADWQPHGLGLGAQGGGPAVAGLIRQDAALPFIDHQPDCHLRTHGPQQRDLALAYQGIDLGHVEVGLEKLDRSHILIAVVLHIVAGGRQRLDHLGLSEDVAPAGHLDEYLPQRLGLGGGHVTAGGGLALIEIGHLGG